MSSRNPNSGTSGSSSPSPSPNSRENRENIAAQREEIQAGETVPKEEEQSAPDTADSASKEEEIPKPENPDEKIPKQENPDEEMAQEEEIPELENPEAANLHEEIPPEGGALYAYLSNIVPVIEMDNQQQILEDIEVRKRQQVQIANQAQSQEIPRVANPHEEIPLEGGALIAYLSNIVPDFEMGEQQQMYHVIQAENRQQEPIANQAQNQEQVLEAVPISYYQSDNLADYGFSSEDSDTFEHENAELDAMYAENLANEPNREGGNRGQETPATDSIHSIPIFEPNRGIGSGELDNPTIADIFREPENPCIDDMLSSIFPLDPGRGIGNGERENPTTAASIPPIEPNRGTGNTDAEDPTIAEIAASIPRVRRLRIRMRQNPTIDATSDSRPQNPTIDAIFDSRPPINPNRGFAIRDPQNPTNNPAPAAVLAQQDKGKGKVRGREEEENSRPTKTCKCISESCFLFPTSTSEEEDDITTLNFLIAYRRNQGPLPSAESPDGLFAFITSQLPEGESISLETLKGKLAILPKKYVRLLRQREFLVNFQTMATHYDRELYRLGGELWDNNANAQGYQFPGGNVGRSGASGDGS